MECLQKLPLPSPFYQNVPPPQDRIGGFRKKSVLWRRYYRVIFFAILFLKHNSHMAQYFPKIYRESSVLFKKTRFNDPILIKLAFLHKCPEKTSRQERKQELQKERKWKLKKKGGGGGGVRMSLEGGYVKAQHNLSEL